MSETPRAGTAPALAIVSPALAESARPVPAITLPFAGGVHRAARPVAVERPVQIVYGDVPFGVMMLTPEDLADFAFGFSLTEGVIEAASDIRGLRLEEADDGFRLAIDLAGPRLHAHLARRRTLSGRTGCGVCGIEDLSALSRAQQRTTGPAPLVRLSAISKALDQLGAGQSLNALTHAVHGAAWCAPDGEILVTREDVGRHNALDKLIGALLRAGPAEREGFVLITSRASFEMVEKVATFGVRTLVAISAPTSLAIERAQALELTLIGIARRDAVTVFNGFERVFADSPS